MSVRVRAPVKFLCPYLIQPQKHFRDTSTGNDGAVKEMVDNFWCSPAKPNLELA